MTNKQYENIGRLAEQWMLCSDGMKNIGNNLFAAGTYLGKFTDQDNAHKIVKGKFGDAFACVRSSQEFFDILRDIILKENKK